MTTRTRFNLSHLQRHLREYSPQLERALRAIQTLEEMDPVRVAWRQP
ncbi:MAG: hypothetical protein ACFCU9_06280 [Cyanophyceae cyanobacterium]